MKTILVCLFVLMAASASAQSLQDCYNNIAIFNSPEVDLDELTPDDYNLMGVGSFTVYVVLINPFNEHTGEMIDNVGGFEFRLEAPAGAFVTPNLPPGVIGCEYPDFHCSIVTPVTNNQCALLSINIGLFTMDPGYLYLSPLGTPDLQTIPGDIAIMDADDDFSWSRAAPIGLDFASPVYGINSTGPLGAEKNFWDDCWVVPSHDRSWSSIKAMYR